GLARAAADRGDLDAARRHVERTVAVVESLRTATENRDLRASYLASVFRYHDFEVDVLMRLHRARPGQGLASAAFEASEPSRAHSLLDGLREAGIDLRQGLDPELLKREQALERAFEDWTERRGRLGSENGAEPKALADEYEDLERRYAQVQADIRATSPRYAALARPKPLSLAEVRQQVLDPETLLLEYALGEERSYLWAVSRTEHWSYELPRRELIEQAASRAYGHLTARLTSSGDVRARQRQAEQRDADYWAEAARLSEMLLGPVASRIRGKKLLVVGDGALQYLPFAALPIPRGGKDPLRMVVEHEVVSLPSATVLAVVRREARNRTPSPNAVAVLADPVFERDDPRLAPAAEPSGGSGAAQTGGGSERFPRLLATRQEA